MSWFVSFMGASVLIASVMPQGVDPTPIALLGGALVASLIEEVR